MIEVVAWGSKHGTTDGTLVVALTGLRNPYRRADLRDRTGWDDDVAADVWASPGADARYARTRKAVLDLLEIAAEPSLRVVFVCRGGRHRSVVFARRLAADLERRGHEVELSTPFAPSTRPRTRVRAEVSP